ncbi:MAG: LysE family translocator [Candidatus Omnitrophica bacterium]|nr:LysE family translocator [Candidatus Omnitrophota bacterium]MBU1852735.1 LysE family translocator [Candidatus Omnitrophota bacterium]
MNLLFIFFTGITIGISGAMIPGPLTFFTVREVLKTNRFASLRIILGHIILEFVLIAVIFLGFQRFLSSKEFLLAISIVGGVALIIMGIIIFLTAAKMNLPDKGSGSGFSKGLILGGIFFSIISPGFIAWWTTIGLSTVMKALLFGVSGAVILTLGHWLADILWYWFLSYAIEKSRRYLSDRSYQNVLRFVSVILIILGIRFLII